MPLDEAVVSRAVFVIVAGSDGKAFEDWAYHVGSVGSRGSVGSPSYHDGDDLVFNIEKLSVLKPPHA